MTVLWLQRSGGKLPEAQARSLLVGIGPAIPPPTLTGLPVPRQTISQQTWQAAPQASLIPLSPSQPVSCSGKSPLFADRTGPALLAGVPDPGRSSLSRHSNRFTGKRDDALRLC